MSTNIAYRVAESMRAEKLRKYEERKCPRKFCAHEYKAIESHPQL